MVNLAVVEFACLTLASRLLVRRAAWEDPAWGVQFAQSTQPRPMAGACSFLWP
jgi:hypothetical protein